MKRLLLVAGVFLLIQSGPCLAEADGHWRHYHYRDHPHFGSRVTAFYPGDYYPVYAAGARYYYDDGVYYDYRGGVYQVVPPPVGAVVLAIPNDFQPVVINGVTYYVSNGTYYLPTPSGYKVVSPGRMRGVSFNVYRKGKGEQC